MLAPRLDGPLALQGGRMTKADLVEKVTAQIARTAGPLISKKDCARVVDSFLDAVKAALAEQHNRVVRASAAHPLHRRAARRAERCAREVRSVGVITRCALVPRERGVSRGPQGYPVCVAPRVESRQLRDPELCEIRAPLRGEDAGGSGAVLGPARQRAAARRGRPEGGGGGGG